MTPSRRLEALHAYLRALELRYIEGGGCLDAGTTAALVRTADAYGLRVGAVIHLCIQRTTWGHA